jgi:hypothetical protein
MKWIVVSDDSPDQLDGLLASSLKKVAVTPNVLVRASANEADEKYAEVALSYRAAWFRYGDGDELPIRDILYQPKPNGTLDPLTLLTTDNMRIVRPINAQDALAALDTPAILGLSLLDAACVVPNTRPLVGRTPATGELSVWDLDMAVGSHRLRFAYGIVYRTSDILNAIVEAKITSVHHLEEAIERRIPLRRNRMACLPEASIIYQ